ncbi:4'-phosphopantetheinyl transferase superfamily protein [Flavobacterium piscinae]|uniref:4'-phosphopantetheinyl transferase superfamily protein n=1 Tax=Flavobacterium piscinae TaxID=2506424 RepID=A0A4Q1KXT2_9FLAO|nr:4'-phosphopantetheinyl transferase superfamily protein [Flavobacterium piscinae]RXR34104.1 4'-phosphopantetheinyl transferase superfamily protein [Flavobacterium piscinae]
MPFYQRIKVDDKTAVFVWKITESFNDLFREVSLKDTSLARLEGMKSESHQKGFMAVRMLLQYNGYTDFDLYYDEFGKPHLKDGVNISISHSFDFSVIILSDKNVGIDLELRRDLVKKIAYKFAEEVFVYECKDNSDEFVSKLTVIWGVKEAVFKVRNEIGISFKDHIFVRPFEMKDEKTTALLDFNSVEREFLVYFIEIENYTLVWLWEAK